MTEILQRAKLRGMYFLAGCLVTGIAGMVIHSNTVTSYEKMISLVEEMSAQQSLTHAKLANLDEKMNKRIVEKTFADGSTEKTIDMSTDKSSNSSENIESNSSITTKKTLDVHEKISMGSVRRYYVGLGISLQGEKHLMVKYPIWSIFQGHAKATERGDFSLGLGIEF